MSNVRRWYIYLICAITIDAVVWSVISLLRNLIIPGIDAPTTALALEIAVIIIALPIYLIHWLWAQRNTESEADERASLPRRLYLYVILAAFLAPFLNSIFGLVRSLFFLLFGKAPEYLFYPRLDPGEQTIFFLISAVFMRIQI